MFASCTQGGMCFAMPDVCKVPAPPAPPIPTPFPNQAMLQVADGGTVCEKVYIDSMEACNMKTKIPQSNGDQGGVAGGMTSGKFMGPASYSKGSAKVFMEGSPALHLTCPTKQNGDSPNAMGTQLQPSQTKVMIMG